METTIQNRLKFDTFRKKRNKTFVALPKWFDGNVYMKVLENINKGNKLQAVKFLYDLSRHHRTNEGLKWAKVEVVDEIIRIGGGIQITSYTPTTPLNREFEWPEMKPKVIVNKQEIIRVLEPFARMANECLHNSNLHRDQVVYAYNKAQITMQDLRNVEALLKRLAQ